MSLKISSNIRNYEVHFADTTDFIAGMKKNPQRFYVVDHNVWRLYEKTHLKEISGEDLIIQPIDEERKSLESVQDLYDRLSLRSAKRNMTLISIGGGILQDITGFTASTLYRGINWIFIPTTLLAQADSCIGSKTSLNYRGNKNLIGTFYPPSEVFIHIPFLYSQTDVDFFSGLGEVVKLHILGGETRTQEMIDLLPLMIRREPNALRTAVQNALRMKQGYITEDEFDSGKRNMLNFGHCFGHALEAASNFEIPHGQAIIMGMLLANLVSSFRKMLSDELQTYLAEKLLFPSLRVRPKKHTLDPEIIVRAMKKDKKRTGEGLALILLQEGYEMMRVNDLMESEVSRALQSFKDF